jgi:phosphoglucosamine mutase
VGRLFGTDGVRGVAGTELTAELARSLAVATVQELVPAGGLVAVARDPRPSGGWLQAAVIDGLCAAGADVVRLGVVPTPAAARALAAGVPGLDRRPDLAIVVSASHNPVADNGIKLFGAGGRKLADSVEAAIEARLTAGSGNPAGGRHGAVVADLETAHGWYVEGLLASLPQPLDGMRVVVDCANGSAATVAREVYTRAGAEVVIVNDDLSGEHINDRCGATHLAAVRAAVVDSDADAGIAHDGDADRCLAVGGDGTEVDGDAILAVLAIAREARGELPGHAVAATVMSNLGLSRALRSYGVDVRTTDVGDRYVTQRMRADGLVLGGEQSGHIVMLDAATTGDGLLTALHLLATVAATGRSLVELASVVERLPQVLVNVTVADRDHALQAIAPLVADAGRALGDDGRVLVRPSGTEPLIRVMVEATTQQRARQLAEELAAAVR